MYGVSGGRTTVTPTTTPTSIPTLAPTPMPTPLPTPTLLPGQLTTPILLSPPDGSTFTYYPRTTTLAWQIVPGATSYHIIIECSSPGSDGNWDWFYWTSADVSSTSYRFDFVGAQPGRWSVTAKEDTGRFLASLPSEWRTFTYTQ